MPQEISLIERYPNINWSREGLDEHGDPMDTYGLIGIRSGPDGVLMNLAHQFVPLSKDIDNVRGRLFVGYPGSKRLVIVASPDRPFSLEDAERINQAIADSRELVTAFYQLQTAHEVTSAGNSLLVTLQTITDWDNPSLKAGAGIIESLVKSVSASLLPDGILIAAKRMHDLGVEDLLESGTLYSYAPWWILANPIFQPDRQDVTQAVTIKKGGAEQPVPQVKPTHITVLDMYTSTITNQLLMLNTTGVMDQGALAVFEAIFQRSQIPSQDIPAMVERLSQLQQSLLKLDPRNPFSNMLQNSVNSTIALLAPLEERN